MKTNEFMTIEEWNSPETTSQALINSRKYVGALLFFGLVQRTFHDVLDEMETENFKGNTIRCMKVAYSRTVERLRGLDIPARIISKYVSDINRATKEAIYGYKQ